MSNDQFWLGGKMGSRRIVIDEGDAVMVRGSNVIGIVLQTNRGDGLAYVTWPDNCGLSDLQAIGNLIKVCDRENVLEAIQVIAPARQLANPLERAFLSAASGQVVDQVEPARPYYIGKGR